MSKKSMYFTQEILGKEYLPAGGWAVGREYYWMKDIDGTVYLAKVGPNGEPEFLGT